MISEFVDRVISVVSPQWGVQRAAARLAMQSLTPDRVKRSRIDSQRETEVEWFAPPNVRASDRKELRQRVRARVGTSAVGSGILSAVADSVVGSGLFPVFADPTLSRRFDEWSTSAVRDGVSFWTWQRECFYEAFLMGDVGIVMHAGARLALIPADLISTPQGGGKPPEGFRIDDGVLIRLSDGEVVGYYVQESRTSWRHYTADQMRLFTVRRELPTDIRGYPALESVEMLLHQLDRYVEAVATAARIAACVSMIVTKNNPTAAIESLSQVDAERRFKFKPGGVFIAEPGETVSGFTPTQPTQNFDSVVQTMIRLICMALRVPVQIAIGDFAQTSLSSARAARAEWDNQVAIYRDEFRYHLEWVRKRWVNVVARLSDAPAEWREPPRKYIDPKVEGDADEQEMKLGLRTFQQLCDQRNLDWRKQLADKAAAEQEARRLGTTLPNMPAVVPANPGATGANP